MRSFLTMLGIIIGVAAVIILVGLVNGQMSYMMDSFSSMGTNQISVNLVNLRTRSVSPDQMYDFYEKNHQYFSQMSPTVSVNATVKVGSESKNSTTITGVSEEYLALKEQKLQEGRSIQYSDLISRQQVCVIGAYVAEKYFGNADKAMNATVKINGEAYMVVGVVDRQASAKDTMDEGGSDDFIYLPYTTAEKLAKNGNINNYVFTTKDTKNTYKVKALFDEFLYPIFKDDSLYHVMAMSELLDSLNSMLAMMSAVLGGIAGISLLVAGIGIMNIMLVSVTERTREIGIRKSLGARRSTIMQQFVIEAAVTSSIGGVIGIVVGSVLTGVIGNMMKMKAFPTVGSILLSFGVSVGIGLLFGYMPASRASKLNPIDALRSE